MLIGLLISFPGRKLRMHGKIHIFRRNKKHNSCRGFRNRSEQINSVESPEITITDGLGRNVTIPENVEKVVCSGAGCLRYLVYLQAQDYVVGVDSLEKTKNEIEGRPYVLANPQLKDYPLIGEARGKDDPEKIIEINPQVILKTSMIGQSSAPTATEADTLQSKTDIPVVSLPYGSLSNEKEKAEMYSSLRIMGRSSRQTGKGRRNNHLYRRYNARLRKQDC